MMIYGLLMFTSLVLPMIKTNKLPYVEILQILSKAEDEMSQ